MRGVTHAVVQLASRFRCQGLVSFFFFLWIKVMKGKAAKIEMFELEFPPLMAQYGDVRPLR